MSPARVAVQAARQPVPMWVVFAAVAATGGGSTVVGQMVPKGEAAAEYNRQRIEMITGDVTELKQRVDLVREQIAAQNTMVLQRLSTIEAMLRVRDTN
jgi:hypothetical protein